MKSIFGGRISYIDLKSKKFMDALVESFAKGRKKGEYIILKDLNGKQIEYPKYNETTKNNINTYMITSPNDLKTALGVYFNRLPSISDAEKRLVMSSISKLFKTKETELNESISQNFINSLNSILSKVGLNATVIGGAISNQATNAQPTGTTEDFLAELDRDLPYVYISPNVIKSVGKVNLTQYPSIFDDLKTERSAIFRKNIDNRYIFKVKSAWQDKGKIDLIIKPIFVRYNKQGLTLGTSPRIKVSGNNSIIKGIDRFNQEFAILDIKLEFSDANEFKSVWRSSDINKTIQPIESEFLKASLKSLFSTNQTSAEASLWVKSWFKDPTLKSLYSLDKTIQQLTKKIDKRIDSFGTSIGSAIDNLLTNRSDTRKKLSLKFNSTTDLENFLNVKSGGEFIFKNKDDNNKTKSGLYIDSRQKSPFIIIDSTMIKKEGIYIVFYIEGDMISLPEIGVSDKQIDHLLYNGNKVGFTDSKNNPVNIQFNRVFEIIK